MAGLIVVAARSAAVSVVGLIPARSGSKRLPGKNLLALDGKPVIAYTCEASRDAGVLSGIFVNTDSEEIAAVAGRYGAACPVLRPTDLAADSTPSRDANLFLLDFLALRGQRFDAVMVLQPTSPLRTAEDVRAAWQLYERHAPCAVVSVCPVAPQSWLGTVDSGAEFDRWLGNALVHRLNGAIYIHAWDDYVYGRVPVKTIAYRMPVERSVDIDTRADFEWAELLLRSRRAAGVPLLCGTS